MSLSESRLDIISSSLRKHKTADEIQQLLRQENLARSREKGLSTEHKFRERVFANFAWLIDSVEDSTYVQDYNGVDFYVTFNQDKRLRNLAGRRVPVQVKSSDAAVSSFKQSKDYLTFEKRIIVINAAEHVPKRIFKKHFIKEMDRISRLIDNGA